MKRVAFLAIFLVGFILMSGCATVKGFGKGLAKDTKAAWRSIIKADQWIEKHAW